MCLPCGTSDPSKEPRHSVGQSRPVRLLHPSPALLYIVLAAALILSSFATAGAATVQVTTESGALSLYVGDTATITVKGLVQNPASSDDGIFTFDTNLIFGTTGVLSVAPGTVTRPDAEDSLYGGSNGTPKPWGLNGIAGGYTPMTYGIGTPKTLFTVNINALAPGSSTAATGPDTSIMGADFVLNQTPSPAVNYSGAGLTFNVLPMLPTLAWAGTQSDHWDNALNWSTGQTPRPVQKAVFNASCPHQPILYQDTSVSGLQFATAGWTLSGDTTRTLNVGTEGISSAGSGTNTINPTVNFAGNAAVNVGQDNTLVLAAVTAGNNALAKSGLGTLVLAGANTYGGETTVSEGTLLANNTSGSGTGTGAVSVGAATLGGTGFINGPVTLTGDSTLTSIGALTINNTLTVQGLANQIAGGTILTTGDVTIDPGAVFIINGTLGGNVGSLIVHGTLMGKGTINKNCIIEAGGVLSPGAPSTIGTLSQILNAEAPRTFSFEIGGSNPNYASPSSSVNDVLRLTNEAMPFANITGDAPACLTLDTVIDVYFLFSNPPEGQYKAQFFAGTDFSGSISGATFQYWRLDPRGSCLHNGNFFSPLDPSLVDWSVVPETATFDGQAASGYITEFTVVPEPATLGLLIAGVLALVARRRGCLLRNNVPNRARELPSVAAS
jgi:autotransporter-associated beta strand protein